MRFSKITIMCVGTMFMFAFNAGAEDLSTIFSSGSVNGNVRAYYNTRDYPDSRIDEAGFALGGALRAETGAWGASDWGKAGVGFYTAQDLNLNSDDPAEVNRRLGDNLEVLGEAYTTFMFSDSALTFGRQKYDTPFANPGDAFMVPFTFQGISYSNKSIDKLNIDAGLIRQFKNRNSDDFVNVGDWTTSRLTGTATDTDGVLYLGLGYKPSSFGIQGWYYDFIDLFNLFYLQADYAFSAKGSFKPFVNAQFGSQADSGDAYLGTVDSNLFGLQAGSAFGNASVSVAYNTVDESEGALNNGAFLAPFSFATSAIFTNSMLETLENVDSGDAYKITFNYNFGQSVKFKLSYASLDFNNIVDRDDVDVDITYVFDGALKGFTIRNRTTFVSADVESVEQINNRFQLQYVF